MNGIFDRAYNTYQGNLVKVDNRNEKRRKKNEEINKSRAKRGLSPIPLSPLEDAFVSECQEHAGVTCDCIVPQYLANKPGINPSIYCYQQCAPQPINEGDMAAPIQENLAMSERWDKDNPVASKSYNDVLQRRHNDILNGKVPRKDLSSSCRPPVGYIPKHARKDVKASKRRKNRKGHPILARVQFSKEETIDLDVRGLLRNLRRWGFVKFRETPTVKEILGFFTECPVIHPLLKVARFHLKDVYGRVHSEEVRKSGPETRKRLEESIDKKGSFALVQIDLGVRHPQYVIHSRVEDKSLSSTPLSIEWLNKDDLGDLLEVRTHVEESIREEARSVLTPDEVSMLKNEDEICKSNVCALLGIHPNSVPWEKISHFYQGGNGIPRGPTTYIADAYLSVCKERRVTPDPRLYLHHDGKRRYDTSYPSLTKTPEPDPIPVDYERDTLRPRLSKDSRKRLNNRVWELQRESSAYKKLAIRIKEWARHTVNRTVRRAREVTGCDTVVVCIEDLDAKFFHTQRKGSKPSGWKNYFATKNLNQWVIQSLHKAYSELGPYKGILVIEGPPKRTSTTCPLCRISNEENRFGEHFRCLNSKCEWRGHADYVGAFNIGEVTLTGKPMPKSRPIKDGIVGFNRELLERERSWTKSLIKKYLMSQRQDPNNVTPGWQDNDFYSLESVVDAEKEPKVLDRLTDIQRKREKKAASAIKC